METSDVLQDLPEAEKEVVAAQEPDDLAGEISREFGDEINSVISEERPEDSISKVKSQVPTYKDWIERGFFYQDRSKEFTAIAGIGIVIFARQFGIYTKKRRYLTKPEYNKLGRLMYKEDEGSSEKAFRASIRSKIKSHIPTYRDWVNSGFYARNGKEFTKMMGSGFIKIAQQFGLKMRLPGSFNKAEYLKLGRLIYGKKEVEAFNETASEENIM